jgi:hypothetical protein
MAAEIMAVPIADVGKLLAAATDDRYRVAVLLASDPKRSIRHRLAVLAERPERQQPAHPAA